MNSSLPAAASKNFASIRLSMARLVDISPEMKTFPCNYVAYAKMDSLEKGNVPAAFGAKEKRKKEKLVNKGLPLFEGSGGVFVVGPNAARRREPPGLDLLTESDVEPAKVWKDEGCSGPWKIQGCNPCNLSRCPEQLYGNPNLPENYEFVRLARWGGARIRLGGSGAEIS
ncbi:hypothetical protein CSAL01_02319 [Colletotrichum salicis]|uniref:Uncharacterized protein n=1 Tax=Colletotrichum salicis TaxID=1209931 RepID=A0A135V2R2_9PEZI|nr:hypothetical protein CSAL01_02319 [Colletotrichum salicis]